MSSSEQPKVEPKKETPKADTTKPTGPLTFQYTIKMPLIPGFKTCVADFCRDPANGITGGFIRWQSMNTIYGIKLDCLFQGQVSVLVVMADLLQRFAVELMKRSTGVDSSDTKVNIPMSVTHRQIDSAATFPGFSIGSTPHKVMDVWRKERTFVQNHAILPLTAPPAGSELARQRSESEDWISGGFDEEVELNSPFWKERFLVHQLWLAEAEHNKQVSQEPGAPVATWRSNSHSNACFCCSSPFGFLRRKHHCRRCGELVCSACSPRIGLALRLLDAPEDVNILLKKQIPQRICVECEASLQDANGD